MTQDLKIPQHIAIIMDGNGRWAKERKMLRYKGHHAGAKAVKQIVREAKNLGVRYLTLYAFSNENWQRPGIEIKALMALLEDYLKNEIRLLEEEGVRLRTIGETERLPEFLQKQLQQAKETTSNGENLDLILALSYGSRQEMLAACKKIISAEVNPEDLNEEVFSSMLDTKDIPDPDLMIRTSNEYRLSNFLLWQLSYAEFIFVPELWPDFTPEVFRRCLEEYSLRKRRFGKVESE